MGRWRGRMGRGAGTGRGSGCGCAVGTRTQRPPCSARLPERPGPPAYEVGSAALPGAKDLGLLVFARPPVLRPWWCMGRGGTRLRPWWCMGRGPSAASRGAQPGERAVRRGRQGDVPSMEADGVLHRRPMRCMGRWDATPTAGAVHGPMAWANGPMRWRWPRTYSSTASTKSLRNESPASSLTSTTLPPLLTGSPGALVMPSPEFTST